ncbi:MAG TPA: DUF1800 family protein, partial [Anaerolineae bacterium]|nr:DUF1800 family protein [Anaerolineae bacterium]
FTIGLIEIDLDGTPILDMNGQEIPSYEQSDVEELARILTGWTFANSTTFFNGAEDFVTPMESWDDFHDFGAKVFGGQVIQQIGNISRMDPFDLLL